MIQTSCCGYNFLLPYKISDHLWHSRIRAIPLWRCVPVRWAAWRHRPSTGSKPSPRKSLPRTASPMVIRSRRTSTGVCDVIMVFIVGLYLSNVLQKSYSVNFIDAVCKVLFFSYQQLKLKENWNSSLLVLT